MLTPKALTYDARFRNGAWQVFDTGYYYGAVGAEPTEKLARQRAATLNARPRPAPRGRK